MKLISYFLYLVFDSKGLNKNNGLDYSVAGAIVLTETEFAIGLPF